jgi:hypothetical protein
VWGEELERFSLEQLESADLLVLRRVTYRGMAAYWTTAQGAIANYMNRIPKLVCSRTLRTGTRNNTTDTRLRVSRSSRSLERLALPKTKMFPVPC